MNVAIRTSIIALLFLLSAASCAMADDLSPAQVVRKAIEEVAVEMRTNEALYQKDQQALEQMARTRVLPYFNLPRMAQLSVARHWRSATGEQKEKIIRGYEVYLARRYTSLLFEYRNVNKDVTEQPGTTDTKATVKMSAQSTRGEPASLFLRLENQSGQWQLIDINVEGVSLIITARELFNDEITKTGMDGFIKSLSETH